jgi:NitT/TauT family transport system substrate-binding protein
MPACDGMTEFLLRLKHVVAWPKDRRGEEFQQSMRDKLMRSKNSYRLAFLVSVILLLLSQRSNGQSLDRVRVGLSALSPTNWAVWVAEEKGLFKKHGIDAQVIFIGGGAARGVNALVAKDVQFMIIGGVGVINAALRGVNVVMVASNVNLSTQRLMARPEIKNPEDLKGKRVGVTAFGSNTHSVLLMLLKRWSMKPDDLVILQIGPSPSMILSLEKNLLDAAVLTSPSDFIAEEKGNRTLADLADMKLYSLQSTLSTTRDYLKGSEDQASRFIRGYSEGIAFIKKNKAQSIEVLRKKLRLDHGQNLYVEKTYALYAAKYLDQVPYVSMQGVKTLLDFIVSDVPNAKSANAESFIDARIVKQLETSGFYSQLYQ